jgi:hypothetical protein
VSYLFQNEGVLPKGKVGARALIREVHQDQRRRSGLRFGGYLRALQASPSSVREILQAIRVVEGASLSGTLLFRNHWDDTDKQRV